jgi:RNA polymerase II-associated factor 1
MSSTKHHHRTIKKPGSGFMCRQRFQNTLPELPFNPKLVEFPFPRDRLYSYKTSQLIENTPYKVLPPDNELGTSLNLIDMKVFEEGPDNKNINPTEPAEIDEEDKILLISNEEYERRKKRSVRPQVSWLRRTEYISNEASNKFKNNEFSEVKMGLSIAKDTAIQSADLSVNGQIKSISRTFKIIYETDLFYIKHPTKAYLKAVEIFPVFPDFVRWPNTYSHVQYNSSPLNNNSKETVEKLDEVTSTQLSNAILKPMQNPLDPSETFLSYFQPSVETAKKIILKRKHEDSDDEEFDDEAQEYNFVRDFEYVTNTESKSKKIFFTFNPEQGGAFYNVIQSKLSLRKKRAKSKYAAQVEFDKPNRIELTKREFTNSEERERNEKLKQILTKDRID